MNVFERFREAFRVFRGRDHPSIANQYPFPGGGGWYTGPSSSDRPDRLRLKPGNERTLVNAAYNRIALDVASVEIHHAVVDENDTFQEIVRDSLEDIMTVEANIDQTSMSYMVDLVMSLFDEGVVAEIPVESEIIPYVPPDLGDEKDSGQGRTKGSIGKAPSAIIPSEPKAGGSSKREIYQLRTAKILEWKPHHIRVECYNEETGQKEQIEVLKRECAIIENPFYSVMNERNSIFQRLVRKLNVLDAVDENLGNNKLNMIMQLPYIVRTDVKRAEAQARLKEVERQLKDSPHGIAWVDGTEKIIQLNRPVENNLMSQVEWLTNMFFSQLGITQEILNGTADEKAMSNYMSRCVGVVLQAICSERKRKFLTADQRKNSESIIYVQDPLKLIPVTSIADIFDKLLRNAVLSPNEARGILGYKPSKDESANMLMNRNMPMAQTPEASDGEKTIPSANEEEELSEAAHSAISGKLQKKARDKIPRIYLRE